MTRLAAKPPPPAIDLDEVQHFVLDGVTWSFYEHLLKEIGDRPIRVTFDDGTIEVMAPLSEHEIPKEFIGWMIKSLALLINRPMKLGGSTTFRRREKQKGLEPDDCYFFESAPKMQRVKRWNAKIHPAPDLAVEIDIFSRSIDREPIYAALGVRELWRYDGQNLRCYHLIDNQYSLRKHSKAFPFLEVGLLRQFLDRLDEVSDDGKVMREFMAWVKKNGWATDQD